MPAVAAEHPVRPLALPVRCPECGEQVLDDSGRCSSCNSDTQVLPPWALYGRDRRLFTRKRLIRAGIVVLVLVFLLWLNYPFLPNYRVLLFNRPVTAATSNSAPAQWTMEGGDLAQTKAAPAPDGLPGALQGTLKWSASTGQATRSGPVVADGKVYLGGHFKALSLDAETGAVLWEKSTKAPVQGTPALAAGNLYVASQDHRLTAMDPANGDTIWEFLAGDIITSAPVIHDGMVYVGTWGGMAHALDAATGDEIWAYQADDVVASHSPIADGVMALADRAGKMHLVDARTGQNRLVYRTPKSAYAAPVIAHDLVFFAAGGSLYAINAREKEIPGQYHFKRVWAQLWLWQVPGVPRPSGQQGGRWRFSPDGADPSIVGAPAVAGGRLYAGDLLGNLYALDPLSGREVWRTKLAGGIYASPLIVGEQLLVATQRGKVYAVDRESGDVGWEVSLPTPVNESLAYANGVLYVRGADGTVHAIE